MSLRLTALLHKNAVMSMPHWRQWYRGRAGTLFAANGSAWRPRACSGSFRQPRTADCFCAS